ncbi:MAG: peptidase T [Bacteroidales bacterium]|nr:peptidase T [Bacteroidales bacterium]
MDLTERFLRYVQIETTSDEASATTPSTPTQMAFAKQLREELVEIGMSEVFLDENAYLYATLPATPGKENAPVVGFIAHIDTAPDAPGRNVRPRIVGHYDGSDIALNDDAVLSPTTFPELHDHIGEDLIVTDGTTLLGADDKAGVAEIVSAMTYLMAHPDIAHGKIRVAFTPDEEIGRGAQHFDVAHFGCDWAYTIDGGEAGELEFENFNAAAADVTFTGTNVHPGTAKGKMVNAARLAMEFAEQLPDDECPEQTEGYEGFYHLTSMHGTVESAELHYIIRDHDSALFEARKQNLLAIADNLNREHPGCCHVALRDQYRNMLEQIQLADEKNRRNGLPSIIDVAKQAIAEARATPRIQPIRGGTDGAQLSFMGLPCPNIFAGGMNMHGRFEYVPILSMEKAMMTIVNICKIVGKQ